MYIHVQSLVQEVWQYFLGKDEAGSKRPSILSSSMKNKANKWKGLQITSYMYITQKLYNVGEYYVDQTTALLLEIFLF